LANRTRGIDILVDILQYCDTKTQTDIIAGLTPILEQERRPDLLSELRKQIILFEDLAYANQAGVQMLLKYVTIKDLAVALIGAPESVVKNIAAAMSKNMFNDLKAEATLRKNVSQSEISLAKERIINEVKGLMKENRLYIDKPDSNKIY
jgi:flagellar motor switch protein FliG